MKILGIDPGSIELGYGIIKNEKGLPVHVADGTIKADRSFPLSRRLTLLSQGLKRIIADYNPDIVAIEEIFFSKNVKSAVILGHARGIALLAASDADLPVFEYSPMTVKQAVVGYGRATKLQVQKMVRIILKTSYLPKPDASDALAIAICHLNHSAGTADCNNKT